MTSNASLVIAASSHESPGVRACPRSFIVCRKGGIDIDIDTADQRLESLDEAGIHGLQPFRMASDVAGEEANRYRPWH